MLKPAFIDLSHHNTVQSLVPAKQSGILGVIHKLTESTGFVDSKVDNRHHLAKQAGMLWGLYHFIQPNNIERQAEFFCTKAVDLGVCDDATLFCLDYEVKAVSLDACVQFLHVVEEMTGHQPVLYSGHVLKEALGGKADPRLTKYRLWIAQYGPEAVLPPGWDHYWGWQYTESGTCPGVNPPVDLNAYWGSAAELPDDWSGSDVVPPAEDKVVTVRITAPAGVKVEVELVENGDVS